MDKSICKAWFREQGERIVVCIIINRMLFRDFLCGGEFEEWIPYIVALKKRPKKALFDAYGNNYRPIVQYLEGPQT